MTFVRKLLYSLLIIGGLTSTVSAGTYASLSATTANSATFQTGSLVLDRKVGATSCFSVGGDTNTDVNANASCGVVINQDRVVIGESFTADLTLTNAGTLPGTLTFGAVTACTSSANPGVNWTLGTGDMCQNTAFVLQEWTAGFGSALATCAYPASNLAPCAFTSPATLTANASPSAPATVLATPGLPLASSPQALGSLAAGQSRYFRMVFQLPGGADNQLQGRRAQFQLSWQLAQ
jgi:hypothetical protein